MLLYDELSAKLGNKMTRKVGNNTYLHRIECDDSQITVRLHRTHIVGALKDGGIILNSGGWRTITTKQRMNLFLPPGHRLHQTNKEWYVTKSSFCDVNFINVDWVRPFEDGMLIEEPDAHIKDFQG